jgi:DNA-binding HxlR family transcriptional regulator
MLKPNVMSSKCASREFMSLLASKWSLLIINALGEDRLRNADLMRAVDGISQKMLTQTLRQLEGSRIVSRHDLQTIPPHVTYELTPLGRSLRREVRSFIEWVEGNMGALRR